GIGAVLRGRARRRTASAPTTSVAADPSRTAVRRRAGTVAGARARAVTGGPTRAVGAAADGHAGCLPLPGCATARTPRPACTSEPFRRPSPRKVLARGRLAPARYARR